MGKLRQDLVSELLEALRPFAEAAIDLDDEPDGCSMWEHHVAMNVTAGDFRRAARVISKADTSGDCEEHF